MVAWANRTETPLIPVSSGAPHFYGDTVPSAPEGVIVDLSRMKAVKRMDLRNRMVVIEPARREATLFLAGHPAPLLLEKEPVQLPDDLVGPALGVTA